MPAITSNVFGHDRNLRLAAIVATIGLPLFIATIVLVLAIQWSLGRQVGETVNAAYQTRLELQEAFSLLQDAETGQRGFMLTDDPRYLAPYLAATARLDAHWGSLARRLAGDPAQLARLERLRGLSAAKLSIARQTIASLRSGHRNQALALVAGGRGKYLMDLARVETSAMEAAAQRRSEAIQIHEQRLTFANGVLIAVLSVGLLLSSWAAAVLLFRGLRAIGVERDQANRANQAKSAFLAMISHELRTPMNGVLGMSHILSRSALDTDQRRCVDIITKSGNGLLVVLNDILDLSKIEAEQIELESIVFDLVDVIVQSTHMWRDAAADKGVRFDLEGFSDQDAVYVLGDGTRIRQILLNLLSNAVKFTARGHITVRLDGLAAGSDAFSIAVSDTGPGLSAQACANLFQPFVQEDASITRRFGGTGLGLAISRRLARLMGGDLTVASVPGQGATFTLTAPLALAEAPLTASSSARADCVTGLNVLVAEDNPQNQMVVRAFLDALGANSTIVDNGAQAVEAVRQVHFDLVLLDIRMPVMGGEDAMRAIRAAGGVNARLPIIALTADAMAGDRERYLAQGFSDHIAKPIDPRRFVEVLAHWSQADHRSGGEPRDAVAAAAAR